VISAISLSLHDGLVPAPFSEHVRGRDTPFLRSLSPGLAHSRCSLEESLRGKKEHIVMRKATLFEGCEIGETNFGVTTIKIGVQAIHFVSFAIKLESKRLYHHWRRRFLARFCLDSPTETN
jgi:hypothetical protein